MHTGISVNLYTDATLTIGTLARRTGVSVSTLRAWERRFGFPVPARLESGHRRYTERDVEAIVAALRERHGGLSIALALERAKTMSLGPRSSLFGALRHTLSDIAPAVLSPRGMLMLSRAIEDEIAGHADQAILIGAFQHERFWRASERVGAIWRPRRRPRSCSQRCLVGDIEIAYGKYVSNQRRQSPRMGGPV